MSAPEFDGQPMTKREVLIAREAVERAVEDLWPKIKIGRLPSPWEGSENMAARLYPLPKVKRSRVVADPDPDFDQKWRVVDGVIEHDGGSDCGRWNVAFTGRALLRDYVCYPTPARIAMWADLLANPTEEVGE